jgi:hypothetical protein
MLKMYLEQDVWSLVAILKVLKQIQTVSRKYDKYQAVINCLFWVKKLIPAT